MPGSDPSALASPDRVPKSGRYGKEDVAMPEMTRGAVSTAASPETSGRRVGVRFVSLYTAAYMSSCLMLIAPLLVTLALRVNALVGTEQAPKSLALVAGTGGLLALFANPVFGRLSDRTTSRLGMRRPWMLLGGVVGTVGTLLIATASDIGAVLVGWCICQVFFNATLAAQAAVLPDQVPPAQRGAVSGV